MNLSLRPGQVMRGGLHVAAWPGGAVSELLGHDVGVPCTECIVRTHVIPNTPPLLLGSSWVFVLSPPGVEEGMHSRIGPTHLEAPRQNEPAGMMGGGDLHVLAMTSIAAFARTL
jgi:hypothetical protein